MSIHGIHLSIISDREAQFMSHFLRSFQKGLGTKMKVRTAFHPQTDDEEKSTIQTLEDILRACVINFKENFDNHLPFIEFSYNKATTAVFPWNLFKHYMVGDVDIMLSFLGWCIFTPST